MSNNMVKGAKIVTLALFITKFLGVIYVIPMYMLLSSETMKVFGISYTTFAIFTQVSTLGFPVGISILISKFRSQNNHRMVNKTLGYIVPVVGILGLVSFLIMFFFAPQIAGIANLGSGEQQYINSLRIMSFTLLVIPIMSIGRGYIQGHEDMIPSAISIVVEQVVRVVFLIFGIILFTLILPKNEENALYAAVLATVISSFSGLIVIIKPFHKYIHKNKLLSKYIKDYDFKYVAKSIIIVSIPLIILSITKSIYDFIDANMIENVLPQFNLQQNLIDEIQESYTIRISKLGVIISTIASAFTISIIPSVTALKTTNNFRKMKSQVTKITVLTLFLTGYVSLFCLVFNYEVVYVLSGYSKVASEIFSVAVVCVLIFSISNILLSCLISAHHSIKASTILIIGIVTKLAFIPVAVYIFKKFELNPQYIFIASTLVSDIVVLVLALIISHKHKMINLKVMFRLLIKVAISLAATYVLLLVLDYFTPDVTEISSGIKTQLFFMGLLIVLGFISLYFYLRTAEILKYSKFIGAFDTKYLVNKFFKKK